jgi:indole-3-glycerol phosphate synthase
MPAETVLNQIAARVRESLEIRKATTPQARLAEFCKSARKPHDFKEALIRKEIRAIAEIKFASPSEGPIVAADAKRDPVSVARTYLSNGAAALSILTEESYFQGNLGYLTDVRSAFPEARLLMKDFVVDPYQILEGLHFGADAVLLIVALLGEEKTREYHAFATSLGLTALVEVHDEAELEIARKVGANLVGVNNRNLKDMSISLDISVRLAALATPTMTLISESGIKSSSEVKMLSETGFSGILVGTSLMKTSDPGRALAVLLQGTHAC